MDTPVARFFSQVTQTLYSYTTSVDGVNGAIHPDIIGVTEPLFLDDIREQADMYMCVVLGGVHSRGVTLLDWVDPGKQTMQRHHGQGH